MRALVWFRSDLRTRDNRALARAAAEACDGGVAVFAVCAQQWREHDWGAKRVDFVLRNVQALSTSLAALNIPLRIVSRPRFAGLERDLLRLAQETGCTALYFNDEYEVNERRRDKAVEAAFAKAGHSVVRSGDQVLLAPGTVRTKQGGAFAVYTPYRRAWLARFREQREELKLSWRPRKQASMPCPADAVPTSVRGFGAAEYVGAAPWPAGEEHALRRLRTFIDERARDYREQREIPAVPGTSMLSPYLTSGVLSARQCLKRALEANDGEPAGSDPGLETWISQLIWRDFYKHLLVAYPRVSMHRPFRLETERLRWHDDEELFAAWCEGRTGFPIVDAAMRQLNHTGWMHNRLRMIVASFLSKDLWLDWRWGERYFMNRLVDGDLALNNGGWQWSASTGTDAQPYFRVFNPARQSERYDPQGKFIRTYAPELATLDAKAIHAPRDAQRPKGYPAPIVDHDEARKQAIAAFRALR